MSISGDPRQGTEPAGELVHLSRPASADATGLLVLHHGRGADEYDLLGLADALDPARRLHVVTPRAPLQLDGSPGYHWYVVPRVGYPDHSTFHESYRRLAAFHDRLWESTGVAPEKTILGGFSMGAVMSYATGLGPDRPRPAGILAMSGFVPTVDDWQPDLEGRGELPVLIAHGRNDPVISVEFARQARELLEPAGLPVEYLESDAAHNVDPSQLPQIVDWTARTIQD